MRRYWPPGRQHPCPDALLVQTAGLSPCGGCGGAAGGWRALCWRWRRRDAAAPERCLTRAGHYYFGRPPYYPFFTNPSLGGTPQANALATEQFWTRMITFLNHLPARQP